jgi:signal transduction histidine kinase
MIFARSFGVLLDNLKRISVVLVAPISKNKDEARQERILNTILVGAFLLFLLLTINTTITAAVVSNPPVGYKPIPPLIMASICLFFFIDYLISRSGKSKLAAYLLLYVSFLVPTYTILKWGAETPQALLTYSLIIVMSGILLSSKAAFLITMVIFILLLSITHLQLLGILLFVNSWRERLPDVGDAVTYGSTLAIVAVISWLSNREMENALKRAHESESDLRRERDLLEVKVQERTRELQQVQAEKIAQIYRFAEFGRLASGLFHDLANPINLVSLNLEALSSQRAKSTQEGINKAKVALSRAVEGMKRLESYVKTARKQLQNQEIKETFSPEEEIKGIINVFSHKTKEAGVNISFVSDANILYYGNSFRFAQLVTNLISNAIDSYEETQRKARRIEIELRGLNHTAELTVTDWGMGISPENLEKIFEPFFTTKKM